MQQQAYPIEHKGTLLPGQTISVNKYTVQVEKYLSQGGFSYVYLVRTATLVYNTTHHVLKRIAVPNEALLSEVKKEVDIMRVLKGHPNIVHLIDAAWHRMSNGQYEVFILMEFCPGGGIIDMMNRRLRERLTEAEILQIFVDVLEGVAAMHNLRPALLHRDLKVENILQSSSTSFKLCDFGSATPITRPPSTTQEIRALEADLNRHTTLQYRPPEMIDPHLRRPIDEKSDVWALGVLLYKLCYYTTPFEEHGPLAILNVQYRIPPYPVYSPQLNGLIVSMLREHGTQRPSVFELLTQVHRMRGTKSRFTYHIVPQQPLSPRVLQSQSATSLDNLVSYRPPSSTTTQRPPPAKNTGVQAREKVLEAIAPMRRGRPSSSQQQDSLPTEPSKSQSPPKMPPEATKLPTVDLLDDQFSAEEDSAWRVMKNRAPSKEDVMAQTSSGAVMSTWKPKGGTRGELDATWSVESLTSKVTDSDSRPHNATFGDNFGDNLWNAYDGNRTGSRATPSTSIEKATPSRIAPLEGSRATKLIITKGKDAFEGLGLTSSTNPPPTLGEARKLRTGLASVNTYNRPTLAHSPSSTATKPRATVPSIKPTPSPSPRPSAPHTSSSWKNTAPIQPLSSSVSSTAPAFPQFGDLSKSTRYTTQPELNLGNQNIIDLSIPSTSSIPFRPQLQRSAAIVQHSSRSEQIPGTPIRAAEETSRPSASFHTGEGNSPAKRSSGRPPSRLSLSARYAVHTPSKPSVASNLLDLTDWLTGDSDTLVSPVKDRGVSDAHTAETPVLREFTNKRSSIVEENIIHLQSPQEAITGEQSPEYIVRASTSPSRSRRVSRSSRSKERKRDTSTGSSRQNPIPPPRLPPAFLTRSSNIGQDSPMGSAIRPSFQRSSSDKPALESPRQRQMSSSDEASPEDVAVFKASRSVEKASRPRHKGRQSSVHDLVDLWGGGVVQTRERPKDSTPNPSTELPQSTVTKPQKNRSIAVPSVTKLNTASPQHLPVANSGAIEVPRSPSRSPNRRSPNSHMKQMSAVNSPSSTPATASRGRPQSLLVFPMSKSTSDGRSDVPVTPSGLSVPQDGSRAGGSRRPSITDMVQRYETIGKVAPSPGHLPLPKSAMTPGVSPVITGRASQQSLHSPKASRFSPSRVTPTQDEDSAVDTDERQLFISSRPSHAGLTDKAAEASRNQSSVSGLPTSSSSKLLSHNPSSQGGIDGLPSMTLAATVSAPSGRRSPSPEKPYQGVGKLIDQWQRKSEEVSRNPAPSRRGFTPKRAGLVGGGIHRDN
ncbi:hypothetical protein JVU11DRAFT_4937 [Chiua virens]|nr:hypothetical protein JVU11DRAFT_4937 [Chiua virens]